MGQVLTFRLAKTVAFQHSFFSTFPNTQFRMDSDNRVPVVAFEMAEQQAILPFDGVKREFQISEYTEDGVMLNAVAQALKFVSLLKVGDSIPAEVLGGNLDGTFQPQNLEAAKQRITAELVGWNLSAEVPRSDPALMRGFVAQYVDDETVRYSLLRLAAHFGFAADGASRLADTIDKIAHETAYIEALRERCSVVGGLGNKLVTYRRDFAGYPAVTWEVDPVIRLIRESMRTYRGKFEEVDNLLGEIVTLFGDFASVRGILLNAREDLLQRMIPWDAVTREWNELPLKDLDTFEVIPRLRELYRFLAARYVPADDWELILSGRKLDKDNKSQGKTVTWYEREPNVA